MGGREDGFGGVGAEGLRHGDRCFDGCGFFCEFGGSFRPSTAQHILEIPQISKYRLNTFAHTANRRLGRRCCFRLN